MIKNALFLLLMSISVTSFCQVTNQRLFDTIPFIPEHNAKRKALFASQPMTTGQIIFLGNSITEGGPWDELLPDWKILNRGIGGDITFGLLQRLDEIIRRKPSHLFILIGINDIAKDIPPAVVADNCRKLIQRMQKESPFTKIFLQSVLPLNPSVPNFPQHYDKAEYVLKTNTLLKDLSKQAAITYIDLYPSFLDKNNLLDSRYTYDGLHLNREGYQRWAAILQQVSIH